MLKRSVFIGRRALHAPQQTHRASSPPFSACRFVSALSRGLDFAVISEKSCYCDCGGAAVPTRISRTSSVLTPRSPIKIRLSLYDGSRSSHIFTLEVTAVNLSGAIADNAVDFGIRLVLIIRSGGERRGTLTSPAAPISAYRSRRFIKFTATVYWLRK